MDTSPLHTKALTLYELNSLVAQVIAIDMPGQYWVEAELSEVREVRGHCYMELVQKEPLTRTPVARASAKCWANTWNSIRPRFEHATGQRLYPGMKVLLCVRPNFHEAYGFSWIVSDINPEYTMGDMARRRKEIIEQLQREGVIDLQKELSISMFAQNIAVISSSGAAGYDDFCNQLTDNDMGLRFKVTLFPAVMQGEGVEDSVVAALDSIMASEQEYDAVVIIRGGGATSDLSGFDTLRLAENVANFPLPIITGIGHNRDESVLDIIAHTSVKTPTAAATLLVDNLAQTLSIVTDASKTISRNVRHRMETEQRRLQQASTSFTSLASLVTIRQSNRLKSLSDKMGFASKRCTTDSQHRLTQLSTRLAMKAPMSLQALRHHIEMLERRTESLDPTLLLKRGYSITTTTDGKIVRDPKTLSNGETIRTQVEHGTITSVVTVTE